MGTTQRAPLATAASHCSQGRRWVHREGRHHDNDSQHPPSLQMRVGGVSVLGNSDDGRLHPLPRCKREWGVFFCSVQRRRRRPPPPPPSLQTRAEGLVSSFTVATGTPPHTLLHSTPGVRRSTSPRRPDLASVVTPPPPSLFLVSF
jgi:hypothetical protein